MRQVIQALEILLDKFPFEVSILGDLADHLLLATVLQEQLLNSKLLLNIGIILVILKVPLDYGRVQPALIDDSQVRLVQVRSYPGWH